MKDARSRNAGKVRKPNYALSSPINACSIQTVRSRTAGVRVLFGKYAAAFQRRIRFFLALFFDTHKNRQLRAFWGPSSCLASDFLFLRAVQIEAVDVPI